MPSGTAALVYFDANIFIYGMETDDDRGLLARRWMMQVDRGELRAVTSELTLAEVLPHPIETRNGKLVDGYLRLLAGRASLQVVPVARRIILSAAELRARDKTDLPDAIHVATALDARCAAFLTEDDRLKLPPELKKLSLFDARYPL